MPVPIFGSPLNEESVPANTQPADTESAILLTFTGVGAQ